MSWSCESFGLIARLMQERAGFRLKPHHSSGHERLLFQMMEKAGLSSPEAYFALLKTDEEAFSDLVDAAMVGETYFFRHPEQFDLIRDHVLPKIRESRSANHIVRVWSAACSTGEEPYSLAILLRHLGLTERSRVIATDISRPSLDRAKDGRFRKWSLRGAKSGWVTPFLKPEGDSYLLSENIRKSVQFYRLNLAEATYPNVVIGLSGVDLILCRNVMIYFSRDTVAQITERLFDTLAPGGFLITAAADPPLDAHADFEKNAVEQVTVYRKPDTTAPWLPAFHEEWSEPAGVIVDLAEPAPEPIQLPPPKPTIPYVEEACVTDVVDPESAFREGDYATTVRLTQDELDHEPSAILHLRAILNSDRTKADGVSHDLLQRHPLSGELHFLRATILIDLGLLDEAELVLKKLAYLERQSPLAHFHLAVLSQSRGDNVSARKAYMQASNICYSLDPKSPLRFSPNETADSLAQAIEIQLQSIAPEHELAKAS